MDETGSTLLHHACAANRVDLATLLLTRGAVANAVNNMGLTPMSEAAVAGHTTLVAVLQAQGGSSVDAMHGSFYPLHAAVMEQDAGKVAAVLEGGSDPNQQDYLTVRARIQSVPRCRAVPCCC